MVKWFKKRTVLLDNGADGIDGDAVGVLAAWKPPGLMDGIEMSVITLILDKIDHGVLDDDGNPTGELYGKMSNRVGRDVIKNMAEIEDDNRASKRRVMSRRGWKRRPGRGRVH